MGRDWKIADFVYSAIKGPFYQGCDTSSTNTASGSGEREDESGTSSISICICLAVVLPISSSSLHSLGNNERHVRPSRECSY